MKTDNNGRLMSLDTLRGLDMLFIMGMAPLIAALCGLWPCEFTDAIAGNMDHVEWNGLTQHDTIFPLFLFIAGVSFPFSLAKQRAQKRSTSRIYRKIITRGLVLVLLGMIYNGLFNLDFANLRVASVLGRIGLAWMLAAIIYLNFRTSARVIIAVAILIGYGLVSYFCVAPDMPGAAPMTLEGNIAGYLDRQYLPGRLIYGDNFFDPEGLLSTIPAIVTAMLGMFTGQFIRRSMISGNRKTAWMLIAATLMIAAGLLFDGFVPINKKLWSSTFVLVVGGYSLAMMGIMYWLVDVKMWRRWTLFFRVVGLNSITIYMLQAIVNLHSASHFFFNGLAEHCPEQLGRVVSTAGYVAVCWLILYFLYRKKVFLKV